MGWVVFVGLKGDSLLLDFLLSEKERARRQLELAQAD